MKRLVLLGAGHAHVHVLAALAKEALAGVEVVLVTPWPRQVYSGMVPGWVAGHYDEAQCAIAVAPLATAAGVRWIRGAATAIDAASRRVVVVAEPRGAGEGLHEEIGYDVLSLDTGATMHRDRLSGAAEHALFVRPIERFVQALDQRLSGLSTKPSSSAGSASTATATATATANAGDPRETRIVVIGGGAAGVELVFALRHRCASRAGSVAGPLRLTLLTGGPPPLAAYADAVIGRGERELAAQGIAVVRETCTAVEADALVLGSGKRLACDLAVVATGAEAPAWLSGSGLMLDDAGFVCTGATLQAVSHPEVFAAGDVASRIDRPHPKSGVFAVRAGPALADNLRRRFAGRTLQAHAPRLRTLNLVSCGDKRAIAVWGRFTAQGAWVWWWKDRIDRAFVDRYTADPAPGGVVTPAA